MRWLDRVPLYAIVLLVVVLGLAPFVPRPHVIEKLAMLFDGRLTRPIDIFDLALHGAPWLLLAAKLARMATVRGVRR